MTRRVYNFNAGPATLPYEVLEEASKAVLEYDNQGMSLLEMSHRSKIRYLLYSCRAHLGKTA